MLPVTAFGAILDTPQRAGAVLRATAARAGVPLGATSVEDLTAAVLGAHAWALATGRSTVSGTMTPAQASGLAPVLARAAGQAVDHPAPEPVVVPEVPVTTLTALEPVVRWARQWAGASALARAATDLAGCPHASVSALGWHLAVEASDELAPGPPLR